MIENINGYVLSEPLKTNNSGFSKWGFAQKDGQEFFIKEFLSPTYLEDETLFSQDKIKKNRDKCREYVNYKRLLFGTINESSDGNLVRVEHFFRYGTKYYITMEKIDAVDPECIKKLPMEQKIRLCVILAHAVCGLHKNKIVHGDIKMDNVIFYKTLNGCIGAKIIDLDNCFWEKSPPEKEEDITCDFRYMAPEVFEFFAEENVKLTHKIDVFALGLLFWEILTGEMPEFSGDYSYAYEALLNGAELKKTADIDSNLQMIIASMLRRDPNKRPNLDFTLIELEGYGKDKEGIFEDDSDKKDDYFYYANDEWL